MRTLMVKEKIMVRVRYGEYGWKEWQETTDSFEVACEKVKVKALENIMSVWQVAKFYYDMNDNFVAWDSGRDFHFLNCT